MSEKPKFFADTHIAKVAVIQLRQHGVEILRCEDVGLEKADDSILLDYAAEHGFVMLSCDRGFRNWGYLRLAEGKSHTGILQLDQERHCQNIGKLVKVVLMFYELSDNIDERQNQLFEGKDFEV